MPSPLLSRDDFPDVGDSRFFVISHNPTSSTHPVKIELRESIVEGRHLPKMSRLLGHSKTVADKDQIIEAATLLEARVGKIDDVVGVF